MLLKCPFVTLLSFDEIGREEVLARAVRTSKCKFVRRMHSTEEKVIQSVQAYILHINKDESVCLMCPSSSHMC